MAVTYLRLHKIVIKNKSYNNFKNAVKVLQLTTIKCLNLINNGLKNLLEDHEFSVEFKNLRTIFKMPFKL